MSVNEVSQWLFRKTAVLDREPLRRILATLAREVAHRVRRHESFELCERACLPAGCRAEELDGLPVIQYAHVASILVRGRVARARWVA